MKSTLYRKPWSSQRRTGQCGTSRPSFRWSNRMRAICGRPAAVCTCIHSNSSSVSLQMRRAEPDASAGAAL
eukprot:11180717-Lingulodinium_polyedra.AAC.1